MIEHLNNLLAKMIAVMGGVLAAMLLLILAFVVSAIVKAMITGILKRTKLAALKKDQKTEEGNPVPGSGESLISYIGKLVYLLVFLLFVPGIFTALGVGSIAAPITQLLNVVWGYAPNVLACLIVVIVGSLIARLAQELLIPVFQKLHVDKLQEKAGIEVVDDAKFSRTLAYIVYVLIMIPVVIVALQALNITAVSEPAVEMLAVVFRYIPQFIVALVLIWVGVLIGRFTGQIVCRLIASTGADEKVRGLIGEKGEKFVLSRTIGLVVTIVLDIFFIVEGLNVLNLSVLSGIGSRLIAYLPNVLAAVLIMVAAFLCSAAAGRAMAKGGMRDYSVFVRGVIIVVAAFMALNQLGIAAEIVNAAFVIILAALGIAFAIAFGVGGRKFAADQLEKLEKLEKKEDDAGEI
ncbi:MAG: mechanosensitive ion channel [Lachnospiraceae bacterium]|nr:mechanosensitive ion channel [Lachnospiraceae bacterium]